MARQDMKIEQQAAEITRLKVLAISERRKVISSNMVGYSIVDKDARLTDFITEHKLS